MDTATYSTILIATVFVTRPGRHPTGHAVSDLQQSGTS
jgi:hypothetical protein